MTEARRLTRRIAKARRRLSRGIDSRAEHKGPTSESAIMERLLHRLAVLITRVPEHMKGVN